MNVEEFVAELELEVRAAAEVNGDFTFGAFLEVMAERLGLAEEVPDLTVNHFEGTGSRNRRLRLDGYALDDADSSLALMIGDYRPDTSAKLTTSDATKAFQQVEAFIDEAVSGRLVDSLEESSEAFRTASTLKRALPSVGRIRIYLATNGLMSDQIREFPPSQSGKAQVTYHIWDAARFLNAHLAINGREDIVLPLDAWLEGGLPCLPAGSADSGFQTFLAVVPGEVLAGIFMKYGSRLLEGNVRSFLSARVKVNKNIRGTLAQNPDLFLAYNNGITATAASVETAFRDGQLHINSITDLQIVNGGQTTASLGSFLSESTEHSLENVFVQMKLVVVDPSLYGTLVPDIARYANTQNRISEADFFSNSPYHRRLEEISRRLIAPARAGSSSDSRWFYERARGQYLNEKPKSAAERRRFEAMHPRSQLLTKTDIAKYMLSWDQKPHDVSLGAQKCFLKFAESASDLWNRSPDEVNEAYFKALVAKALIYRAVHKRIAGLDWYQTGGYLSNLATYTVAKFSASISVQAAGMSLDFGAIWNTQQAPASLLETVDHIAPVIQAVLTSERRGTYNVSEWAKREECWKQVASAETLLGNAVRSELVPVAEIKAEKSVARSVQRVDSGIEAQMKVLKIRQDVWRTIRDSRDSRSLLSPLDLVALKLVTGEVRGAVPEPFQAARLLEIHKKAAEYGVVPRD